jgi:hypothetical protein
MPRGSLIGDRKPMSAAEKLPTLLSEALQFAREIEFLDVFITDFVENWR